MNALFSAAALMLAACPAALPAQTPAPVPVRTETLRLKFTAGQVLNYRLTEDTDGSYLELRGRLTPIKSHLEMPQTLTVTGLRDADSAGLVDVGLGAMTVTVDGKTPSDTRTNGAQAALEALTVIAKLAVLPSGKVVETLVNPALDADEALLGEDPAHMNALAGIGELPAAPVQVGSKWKSAVFLGLAGEQSQADLSLTGWETKDGAKEGDPVAVIKQIVQGKFGTPAAAPPKKPEIPEKPEIPKTAGEAAGPEAESRSEPSSPLPNTLPKNALPKTAEIPESLGDMRVQGWVSGTRIVRLNLALGCVESLESHMYMTVLLTARDSDGKFSGPPTRMRVQVTSKLTRTEKPIEKPAEKPKSSSNLQ